MTKKTTTTPVVKEEKVKAKRVRKPKTVKEVVENPQQVEIPVSPAPISEQELKVAELQAQLNQAQEDKMKMKQDLINLCGQAEEKTKAYDNLRTTYNKLLEDYKVEKNKSKQVSKALEDAKARATEYKSSWNAAKAARDQFASDTAKVKKELDSTKSELDVYVTSWKKARMLAAIFGIAFVASLIVSFVIAFA